MSEKKRIGFVPYAEPWCGYQLLDGTWLRARLVIRNVRRKVGEFNERGDPAYECDYTVIFEADAPDELQRGYVPEASSESEVKH